MLSKLLATAAQGSSGAKSSRSGDFAMVSEGYESQDGPWNLSNAVQVSELKNLIWQRVVSTASRIRRRKALIGEWKGELAPNNKSNELLGRISPSSRLSLAS